MGRALVKPLLSFDLADALNLDRPVKNEKILMVSSAKDAAGGSLAFLKDSSMIESVDSAAVLICAMKSELNLLSANPRLDFVRSLHYINSNVGFLWNKNSPQIHKTARIHESSHIGDGVVIGANTVVEKNVVIADEVVIGNNCLIKSGSIIGESGFGFERDCNGNAIKMIHLGTVWIGNDVEIGALNTIARGVLDATQIKSGVKTDDQVHIAHNVIIDESTLICACAEISGGVRIGKRVWLGPNCSIMNQITIGDDSVIGLGAIIARSVDGSSVYASPPARLIKKL